MLAMDDKSGVSLVSSPSANNRTNDYELLYYEKQRHEEVSQKFHRKRQSLESEFKKFDEENEAEHRLIRQEYMLKMIRKVNAYQDDYKALADSIARQTNNTLDNSFSSQSKLREIEAKHQQLLEEQQKRHLELRQKQLLSDRSEVESVFKACLEMSHSAQIQHKNDNISHTIKVELQTIHGLLQNIDILLTKPDLNDYDLNSVHNIKQQVYSLRDKVVSDIHSLKQLSDHKTDPKPTDNSVNIIQTTVDSTAKKSVSQSVDVIREYLKLQKISNDFEDSFQRFATDSACKQRKNALQLFVKTTINTISCLSADHLRDKLNRLTLLFSERPVEHSGKQIKCSQSDGSLYFCISLASKTFLSVCTKQKDIELAMGPVIALLWARFPTFGQIFMAQLQEKCPYAVPFYPERESDENETNYLIACGYTIAKDGTQEAEESFLNRMRAMIRLYSSVIQCNLESGHPHGLKSGWNWLARVLNAEPRPAITAAVLEAFLSISCHKFYRFYGKQFHKIIEFIHRDYAKRVESVSAKDTKRQSLVKLQMFIDNVFKKMRRNCSHKELIPDGLIPDYFFQSSYSFSRGLSFSI